MPRIPILFSTLVAAGCLAGTAAAFELPPGWSHAQINIVGPRGRAHTFVYDRGRVQAVSGSSLTLREPDGSIVTIQVAADAVVIVNHAPGSFSQIQPGYWAMTVGVDGAPARRVKAVAPPPRVARRGATGPTAGSTP